MEEKQVNIFKKVFSMVAGSPKVVEDIFDKDTGTLVKIGGFINDLHLSDAEILKANVKTAAAYTAYIESTLSESTQRSKTRRSIANTWMALQVWLIKMSVLGVLVDFIANLQGLYDGALLAEAVSQITFSGLVWSITSGVGAFFFATHLLRAHKGK